MRSVTNVKHLFKIEARDSMIYIVTSFISKISSFLIVPLFWNRFTPFDFGIIAIVEMIMMFSSKIMSLSLDQGITRLYPEWQDSRKKANTGAIWISHWLAIVIIGLLILYLLSFVSELLFRDVAFRPFILLGTVNGILMSLGAFPFALLRIMKKVKIFSFLRLGIFFVQLSLNVLFVLFLNRGLVGFYISNIIINSAAIIPFVIIFIKYAKISVNFSLIRETLKYCLPLIPSSLIASLSNIVDRFLLQKFISIEILGLYSVAMKFANVINFIHTAIKMSYVPFMFNKISNREDNYDLIKKATPYYLIPIFMVGIAISLFIDDFVTIVNNPEYFGILNISPFLVLLVIIQVLYIYLSPGILISKKTSYLLIPSIFQIAIITILNLVLLKRFLLTGLILTRYISAIIYLGICIYFSKKLSEIRIDWKNLLLNIFLQIGIIAINWIKLKLIENIGLNIGIDFGLFLVSGFLVLKFAKLKIHTIIKKNRRER